MMRREGRAHRLARRVRPLDHRHRVIGERQAGQSALAVRRAEYPARAMPPTGWDPLSSGPRHLNLHRLMIGAENPRMVDLGEIVIFRRQPEHGHGGNAARRQFPRRFDRRERLVNRVGGTGKQARPAGPSQSPRFPAAPARQRRIALIQRRERPHQRGAPIVGKIELRGGRKRLGIVRAVGIKIADPIKMIDQIGEKPRRSGDVGLADTRTLHGLVSDYQMRAEPLELQDLCAQRFRSKPARRSSTPGVKRLAMSL